MFLFVEGPLNIYSCLRKRAILARLPHSSPELTVDGCLSPEKIVKADPPIKEVLNVGATWTWVPRHVFQKYPGLAEIAQSAGNYLNNASKAEHDGQLILKIGTKIAVDMPFNEIKEMLLKNRSKNMESLPGMYHFLRKFGGGKAMQLAKRTSVFIRGEANTSRRVAPEFWDALGADFRGVNQMIGLRHGALCTLYTDPNPKLVSVADIKGLQSKDRASAAADAETAIDAIDYAINNSPDCARNPVLIAEFMKFQSTVFSWLVGKRSAAMVTRITSEFEMEFDKLGLGHLQWHFINSVSGRCKLPSTMKDFAEFKLDLKPAAADGQAKAASAVRESNADMTAGIMADLGWHLKDVAEQKSDKGRSFELTEFANGFVKVTSVTGGKTKRVPLQEFQDKSWKSVKGVATASVPVGTQRPSDTDEYQLNLVRSLAFFAVRDASTKQEGIDLVKVNMKPSKSVEALDNIPKGKLQLAPETFKLTFTEKAKCSVGCEAYSNSSLFLGSVSVNSKQYNMFAAGVPSAMPSDKSDGMQAPFWSLDTVAKESEANVVLSHNTANQQIKTSKLDAWLGSECTTSDCMKVPMLVSSKAINAGDKLKLFVPSKRQKTGPSK